MVDTRSSGTGTHDGKVYQRTNVKKKAPPKPRDHKAPQKNISTDSEKGIGNAKDLTNSEKASLEGNTKGIDPAASANNAEKG